MKEKKKQKIGLGKYLKNHKFGISVYVFIYLIASACSVASTLVFAEGIVYIAEDVKNYQTALILFAVALGIYILRRACYYFSTLLYLKISTKIMIELNYDISSQAFKLNSRTYTDNNTGTFVQRMVQEPKNIVRNLADLVEIITEIITSLFVVIYIATLNIYVGIIIAAVVVIASIVEKCRMTSYRRNQEIVNRKNDKVNSITTEIVRSEKDIKSLGLEDKLSEVAKEHYVNYQKADLKKGKVNVNFYSLRNLLLEVVEAGILVLGVFLLDKSLITLATFMLLYSNGGDLRMLVWNIGNILDYVTSIKISSKRMFELFDEKEFQAEKFGTVALDKVVGSIEFRRVDFTFVDYEEKPDVSKMSKKERKEYRKNPPARKIKGTRKIFDNLSFKIKPNTTVAFVGKSGSGKSTILNLMSKMYVVDDGEVLIDGVNINDLDKNTLRSNISLVNQFPYIFDMSIKDNLLLAKKDATEEEIMQALKKSSLTEFVSSLPEGINTKVGESGIKLSGGQKQRLAIARALLRNSPIIIFDESTSSLDNFAQEDIKQSIEGLKGHGTIVIVAHRLSTIRNADQIFFLDDGKIIDIGTFDELFENNVKFKNMFFAENLEQ